MSHRDTIYEAAMKAWFDKAFKVIAAKELDDDEAARQHEEQMRGWMNDLDQDAEAIQDFLSLSED